MKQLLQILIIAMLALVPVSAIPMQTPTPSPVGVQTKAIHSCGAPTKKGTACKRRVKAAGLKCYQHKEK